MQFSTSFADFDFAQKITRTRWTAKSFRFDMKALVGQGERGTDGKGRARLRGESRTVHEGSVSGAQIGKHERHGVQLRMTPPLERARGSTGNPD